MTFEITEYRSRKDSKGSVSSITWEQLVDKLKTPVFTDESIEEYQSMTNEQRTEIKDVGGFIGGRMKDGVRRKIALENRTVLTIDADEADKNSVSDFEIFSDTVYCCHTTHSSTPEHPRLRWVFPLARPVTAEEYTAIAHVVANWIGVDSIDETTDQPERLMFWPSVSLDADYGFWEGGAIILDPDEILKIAEPIAEQKIVEVSVSKNDEPKVIPEGQRNKTVFSFAATLRGAGIDYKGIRKMISGYNEDYCDPPLPEEELDAICRSVGKYKAGDKVMASLRDAWDDFNDLGTWVESPPKKAKRLFAESAESLCSRYVEPPKYIVPGLITYGITILASPPKFGKSWMCLDMALSVATGTEFMGLETSKDGVIYLALEDGDYRLKDRMMKVANGRSIPGNLYLVKEAPILRDGLLKKIKALICSKKDHIGMIIIDTLQKIRGVAGKTEGAYGYDYRELAQVHQFALDMGLAIVLVHHLNKVGDNSDFVSRLNGTTGISGAADTIITLTRASRGADETKMSITGRDIQERVLIIKLDVGHFRWICLGEEKSLEKDKKLYEFKSDPIVKTILWHLASRANSSSEENSAHTVEWSCTTTELISEAERLYNVKDMEPAVVGRRIIQIEDLLEKEEGISHRYSKEGRSRSRIHTFSRVIG